MATRRTLFCPILFALVSPALAEELSASDVIGRLKENPFPASYTADIAVAMSSLGTAIEMNGTIAYDRGSTKTNSSMTAGGEAFSTTMTMGPDGIQWVETTARATNTTQVTKLDRKSIEDEFGPLPGANLLGQGGTGFQPAPGMYDEWLATMDLKYEGMEKVEGEDCYVLSGTYKAASMDAIDPNGNLRAIGGMPDQTIFYVAVASSFPLKVEFESERGINGTITLSNVNLKAEFEPGEFEYSPPADAIPMDITEMVRGQAELALGKTAAP